MCAVCAKRLRSVCVARCCIFSSLSHSLLVACVFQTVVKICVCLTTQNLMSNLVMFFLSPLSFGDFPKILCFPFSWFKKSLKFFVLRESWCCCFEATGIFFRYLQTKTYFYLLKKAFKLLNNRIKRFFFNGLSLKQGCKFNSLHSTTVITSTQ